MFIFPFYLCFPLSIAELKMEILRERELRESIEKQLMEDQRNRVLYQKRLKKERRARRRLTDQLDKESKRRTQFEEALKAASSETFRAISGELTLTFGTFDNHRFVRMRSIISSRLSRLFPFSWYENFH